LRPPRRASAKWPKGEWGNSSRRPCSKRRCYLTGRCAYRPSVSHLLILIKRLSLTLSLSLFLSFSLSLPSSESLSSSIHTSLSHSLSVGCRGDEAEGDKCTYSIICLFIDLYIYLCPEDWWPRHSFSTLTFLGRLRPSSRERRTLPHASWILTWNSWILSASCPQMSPSVYFEYSCFVPPLP